MTSLAPPGGGPGRIAAIETLECLLSARRSEYLHALDEAAPGRALFEASLPPECIVPVRLPGRVRGFLNDDEVVRHSDLGSGLSRAGATAFVPSYRASATLERWARGAGLDLLSPPWKVQLGLEDKIAFDGLLRHHGVPVPEGDVLHGPEQVAAVRYPLVCQLPGSEGMEGTRLVEGPEELRRLLREGVLSPPLICRRYVLGRVLGITLVVGTDALLLSAVRDQCRGLEGRDDLAGVQWVAGGRLAGDQRASIEATMARLGEVLRVEGFLGAAAVDFVLEGDRALVIECNPRFSSASPQLSAEPELLHGLDFFTEYVRAVRGETLGAHRPRLPESSFEGAYVDFGDHAAAALRRLGRRVPATLPRVGVHEVDSASLRFVSSDVADLRGGARLLFHCATPSGRHLGRRTDLGSVFTTFPLFASQGRRLVLTGTGEQVLSSLRREVRLGRPLATLEDLLGPGATSSPPAARGG